MRKISVVLLSIILLSGCAVLGSLRPRETNTLEVARLGITTDIMNNELVVKDFSKKSAARLAGVKKGDVFVSIDGNTITTQKTLLSILENKEKGEHVLLIMNRNGKHVSFDIEPIMIEILPTSNKINHLLMDNHKVSVAIIVTEVKNSFRNVPNDWVDSMRTQLQTTYESGLLKGGYGNTALFSIVDRTRLRQILNEFQFSQSSFVSDKVRVKIGEMTGATHIIDISFARFQSGLGKDDVMTARLIDIETGNVLAVDQVKSH